MRRLVDRGAEIDVKNLLLRCGANLQLKNDDGVSALTVARIFWEQEGEELARLSLDTDEERRRAHWGLSETPFKRESDVEAGRQVGPAHKIGEALNSRDADKLEAMAAEIKSEVRACKGADILRRGLIT